MRVKIVAKDDLIPKYAKLGDVGCDLKADLKMDIVIFPDMQAVIPTGVKLEMPEEIMATVHPRSGLVSKGIIAITGIIDSSYRGEIKVNLLNLGPTTVRIKPGDRIAQLVFNPVARVWFKQVDKLSDTERGEGGFGHTGT